MERELAKKFAIDDQTDKPNMYESRKALQEARTILKAQRSEKLRHDTVEFKL